MPAIAPAPAPAPTPRRRRPLPLPNGTRTRWSPREGGASREDRERFLSARRLALLLGLLGIGALALLQLGQSWRYLDALNGLHEAQTRVEALRAERDRLLFEVGRAFSLERIEQVARERLGMTRPEPRFLVLPPARPR